MAQVSDPKFAVAEPVRTIHPEALLQLDVVSKITGLSSSAIYRRMAKGTFPLPKALGRGVAGLWRGQQPKCWDGWSSCRMRRLGRPQRGDHVQSHVETAKPTGEKSEFEDRPSEALVRLRDVKQFTGLSTSTIYKMMAEGEFPQPLRLGKKSVAWRWGEITDWAASRPRVKTATAERRPRSHPVPTKPPAPAVASSAITRRRSAPQGS